MATKQQRTTRLEERIEELRTEIDAIIDERVAKIASQSPGGAAWCDPQPSHGSSTGLPLRAVHRAVRQGSEEFRLTGRVVPVEMDNSDDRSRLHIEEAG
ncbi:hypothetical protein [Bradyrhizobium commune]|uniref:hypothetical protein n=1 Tax=Bradyrhizobium commune TaxID=83627 RepID=UPI001FEFAF35|nr:hypothetical protein [Bradyrhizobium commune]